MKFLKEERIVIFAFLTSIIILSAILYSAFEFAPKIENPKDNCEIGCPVHAPCHPDCKKEKK